MAIGIQLRTNKGLTSLTSFKTMRIIDTRRVDLNYATDKPLQHEDGRAYIWDDYTINLGDHRDFSNINCYAITNITKLAIYTDWDAFTGAKNRWVTLEDSCFTDSNGFRKWGLGYCESNNNWSGGIVWGDGGPTSRWIGDNTSFTMRLIFGRRTNGRLIERLQLDTFLLEV